MSIALVTTSNLPKPDPDTHLLAAELRRLGAGAEIVPWDQPHDWPTYALAVLRSPWDYPRRIAEFLPWAERASAATRLCNPIEVLRWNAHKSYLLDLAAKSVPIVPTRLFRACDSPSAADVGDAEVVVKPAIGSGAREATRGRGNAPAVRAHLTALLAKADALVQPFVPDVATTGEVSLIYFESRFSHALRKTPAAGDYRVQELYGGALHPHEPTASELAVAEASLACAPARTTYARVDLVTWQAAPAVMELELIEPELFLRLSQPALQHFASLLAGLAQQG
jgi:glutathione synthase/RimK-type ligase-like ATP-grasp enzyme